MVLGLKLTFSSSSVSSVLGSRRSLTLLVLAKGRLLGPLSSGIGPSASRARSCREKGAGLAEKRGVSEEGVREEGGRFSMKYQLAFKIFERHRTFVRRLDDELNQNGKSEKKVYQTCLIFPGLRVVPVTREDSEAAFPSTSSSRKSPPMSKSMAASTPKSTASTSISMLRGVEHQPCILSS